MTPNERSTVGRIGAYAQHAKHDVRETTKAGRQAFLDSFAAKVDPDGVLSPAERARRAEAARKAHMTALAHKSAQARRKGKS